MPLMRNALIAAVKRSSGGMIVPKGGTIIPKGDTIIHPGDEIFVVGTREAVEEVLSTAVRPEEELLDRVIIAGASRIGVYLAQMLEEISVHVTMIEPDLAKAEAASALLRKATVLHGDYLDDDALEEAGIGAADGFVSATGEDEIDIMACVSAKQKGATRVYPLIQKPRYLPMLTAIPTLDGAVSRHLTSVSRILGLIRRDEIVAVASLHEVDAEVIEMVAGIGSRISKQPISQVKFPPDALMRATRCGFPLDRTR